MNDLEWLFHDKMRFWPALLESERFNVRNSTTSAILRCSVHFTIYMYLYLYSYRRVTARQLRMYAQMTRCFSAVAELLVDISMAFYHIRSLYVRNLQRYMAEKLLYRISITLNSRNRTLNDNRLTRYSAMFVGTDNELGYMTIGPN